MTIDSDRDQNLGDQLDALLYRWDEYRRRPVVIAACLASMMLVLGIVWFWSQRASDAPEMPIEDRIPVVSLTPASPPATAPQPVLVHVTGAVAHPGVYQLSDGDRVVDALERAGGATSAGQPDRLNLAAPVQDGMQVRVPVEGEPVAAVGAAEGSITGPLDLNSATAAQLESLPGVGPATSAAIVSYRSEVGRFGSVADLLGVRGIGEAKLAALDGLVTVR